MIKAWSSFFTKSVLSRTVCNVGRSKKNRANAKNQQQQEQEMRRSPRSRDAMLRKVYNFCNEQDKPSLDDLYNKQFYQNIQNPQYLLIEVFPFKTSTDFLFRDYPSLIMNIQNEEVFSKYIKRQFDPNLAFIKKVMVYMLSDHQALQKLIEKQQKKPKTFPSFFVVYLKALSYLVLGQFPKAQKLMLEIINSPVKDLVKYRTEEQDEVAQSLMTMGDKVLPHILNLREQMLFNLLAYKMYTSTEQTKQTKNTAMNLHRKIQQKQKLTIEDLQLVDYQSFLNIWLSAKYESILEWVDLNEQQKQPYYNYIYLLAQNAYINKEKQKAMQILSKLPSDYPLRMFMQMSKLYDDKNWEQLIKKYESIWQTMESGDNRFFRYPQYDIILQNTMKIMQKMHKQKKQEDEELQLKEQEELFKSEKNMRETQSKGMQAYYLNVPFREFLVHEEMQGLFEEEYRMLE